MQLRYWLLVIGCLLLAPAATHSSPLYSLVPHRSVTIKPSLVPRPPPRFYLPAVENNPIFLHGYEITFRAEAWEQGYIKPTFITICSELYLPNSPLQCCHSTKRTVMSPHEGSIQLHHTLAVGIAASSNKVSTSGRVIFNH